MKLAVRRTSTVFAAVATAGASTLFFGVGPASAASPEACGTVGDVVVPGVCEVTFTAGTATFTPTAQMTKLEVLLVGAGGGGDMYQATSTKGYAAGGGGEVKIVDDFTAASGPLTVIVPSYGLPGSVTDGTTTATVNNGGDGHVDGTTGTATGGTGGSGQAGAVGAAGGETSFAGGGGAGGAASGANGGAGIVVGTLAPSGSLFTGDTRCFGGGAAIGMTDADGVPGCGGGTTDADGNVIDPVPNSGGGGLADTTATVTGAAGFVAIRWTAANVTLTFDVNGHGTAPVDQSVPAGTTPPRPSDPTASGFEFGGWYTDAALTTPANFAAPLTASATLYAKWLPALAATGGTIDPAPVWLGFGALFAGAALVFAGSRRRRTN
jgi:uncharacterized repeat protein (TIGR02543 family)/LPXTG-motif cell wall-anchored protein